jgi:glycosyltransferase involved in cell wall biosynthesis
MPPIPLLIFSDHPASGTGLGRITSDLATRIATHLPDVFKVATFGYGSAGSSKLPFTQYQWHRRDDWVAPELPEVWSDFANGDKGILFTIQDASRMLWLARPENCEHQALRKWLEKSRPTLWGYFPMDATGPHDRLTNILGHIIKGYDRVLAYSVWAESILRRTLNPGDCNDLGLSNLPHGIDTTVFKPRNRSAARHGFGERIGARTPKGKWFNIPDDAFMIGIVATNQTRKDWGLGIATAAELAKTRNILLWGHTDVLERHWSIPALLFDFGISGKEIITGLALTDEQMSYCYSACDVTLGIGNGEGFGLPIFESLACGTPCIHGDYGGAAEHLPEFLKVAPYFQRIEGSYNCIRNDYRIEDWVEKLSIPRKNGESQLPLYLDWNNLWPRWEEWFRKGIPSDGNTPYGTTVKA